MLTDVFVVGLGGGRIRGAGALAGGCLSGHRVRNASGPDSNTTPNTPAIMAVASIPIWSAACLVVLMRERMWPALRHAWPRLARWLALFLSIAPPRHRHCLPAWAGRLADGRHRPVRLPGPDRIGAGGVRLRDGAARRASRPGLLLPFHRGHDVRVFHGIRRDGARLGRARNRRSERALDQVHGVRDAGGPDQRFLSQSRHHGVACGRPHDLRLDAPIGAKVSQGSTVARAGSDWASGPVDGGQAEDDRDARPLVCFRACFAPARRPGLPRRSRARRGGADRGDGLLDGRRGCNPAVLLQLCRDDAHCGIKSPGPGHVGGVDPHLRAVRTAGAWHRCGLPRDATHRARQRPWLAGEWPRQAGRRTGCGRTLLRHRSGPGDRPGLCQCVA